MAKFGESDDLAGAEFYGADLRGARFAESDLSGVVMRGVEVSGVDIDAPWLVHGDGFLVNGVDVTAYVEAELDRRFPGRDQRRARARRRCGTRGPRCEQAWAPVDGPGGGAARTARWRSRWRASGRSRRRCATW